MIMATSGTKGVGGRLWRYGWGHPGMRVIEEAA